MKTTKITLCDLLKRTFLPPGIHYCDEPSPKTIDLRSFFSLTPEDSNILCGQTLKEKGRRKHKVFSDIFQNEIALTRCI